MQKLIKVMAGETVIDGQKKSHQVQAPCESKNGGYWYCATHKETFLNQFEKDSHIHTGTHRLVWLCIAHGFEQP